jgi:hypothetical protein
MVRRLLGMTKTGNASRIERTPREEREERRAFDA